MQKEEGAEIVAPTEGEKSSATGKRRKESEKGNPGPHDCHEEGRVSRPPSLKRKREYHSPDLAMKKRKQEGSAKLLGLGIPRKIGPHDNRGARVGGGSRKPGDHSKRGKGRRPENIRQAN